MRPFGIWTTGLLHGAAMLLWATYGGVVTMLTPLALLHFHASDWQTFFITVAPPTLLVAAIFWNELARRVSLTRYLACYAACAIAPVGLIALAPNYWVLLALHVVAAIGSAGWTPVNGMLLQRFYPEAVRGRAFAALQAVTLLSQVGTVLLLGLWFERIPDSFRVILPALALLQGLGLALLALLGTRGAHPRAPVERAAHYWALLLAPMRRMRQVLAEDRRFLRYEQAFMTYGCGFMICDALLPLLAIRGLGLSYEEYAGSALAPFRTAILVAMLPAGWLLDRVGAIRISGLSFGLLALYPLLLLRADGATSLAAASVLYGVSMAGVTQGWMLGPVSLAPTPQRVPEYLAIHTTLVGLRGIVFQAVALFMFKALGSFTGPLLLAAAAFLWAAWQMFRLNASDVATLAEAPQAIAAREMD